MRSMELPTPEELKDLYKKAARALADKYLVEQDIDADSPRGREIIFHQSWRIPHPESPAGIRGLLENSEGLVNLYRRVIETGRI